MEHILNQELIPQVNNGELSMTKIHCLISIKEFINRISTKRYLEKHDIDRICEEFKVPPSVTTWGDYFQIELVYEIANLSDKDFIKAVETIKFDIISSYIIFSEKDSSFSDWVENNFELKEDEAADEEYEEAFHLKILKDYYLNLKIEDKFSSEEMAWYESYKEAAAM